MFCTLYCVGQLCSMWEINTAGSVDTRIPYMDMGSAALVGEKTLTHTGYHKGGEGQNRT